MENKRDYSNPPIILVLGMHRSGTSLTAKLVAQWGAYMGDDLLPPNINNPDGYWEYRPLVAFHQKLLKETGNTWFAPKQSFDIEDLIKQFGNEARDLIDEMDQAGKPWCWKDPRMAIFIGFWIRVLKNRDVSFVIVHRDVSRMAASLYLRDRLPGCLAIALWEFYTNQIFEAVSSQNHYFFLSYDEIIENPDLIHRNFLHFLNETTEDGISKKKKALDSCSVRKELNRSQPMLDIMLLPSQNQLLEIYHRKKIPLGFTASNESTTRLSAVFDLMNEFRNTELALPCVQLFLSDAGLVFTENDSFIRLHPKERETFIFQLKELRHLTAIRFDPLNDFVKIRLHKISILKSKAPCNASMTITSNAFLQMDDEFLYDTRDPQITIQFDHISVIEVDTIIVEVEYLKKGVDALEEVKTITDKQNTIQFSKNQELIFGLEQSIGQLRNEIEIMKEVKDFTDKRNSEQLYNSRVQITRLEETIEKQRDEIEKKEESLNFGAISLLSLQSQNMLLVNKLMSQRKSKPFKVINYYQDCKRWLSVLFDVKKARKEMGIWRSIRLVKNSVLFDEQYYLQSNPDVATGDLSPLRHYLLYGGFEGRNPSANFNSSFYLEQYADVKASGMNPLVQYLRFGEREGRQPKPIIFDKFSGWPEARLPRSDKKSNKDLVFSDHLCYPTMFTIVVLSRGDEEKLKSTLNTLFEQSYKHWHCFIIQRFKNIGLGAIKEKESINYSDHNYETISNTDPLFDFLEKSGGFVCFLNEGETLMPECLLHFYNEKDDKTDLLYSDHDTLDNQKRHGNPWFTFNWSPDLLLSQNYIGGFYAASANVFISTCKTSLNKMQLNGKIDSSLAWRYGILLHLSSRARIIGRIPEVLWSIPQKSNAEIQNEYYDECKEINSFIASHSLNVKIDNYFNGKVRHLKWALVNEPLVSIIIPTTGNIKYLKICIDSLSSITVYKNFEVIILDNGKGKYPDGITYAREKGLNVIEVSEDFNWSKLNNLGAAYAKGEILLFLNDDTEVIEPMWLTEMVSLAMREGIGVVGNLLLYPSGVIQHAGVFLVDHGGGARHWFYKQEPNEIKYHHLDHCVREVTATTGACLMVSRQIFDEIRGFDENLALVGNDIDFCLRCLDAGYRNLWTPYSKLIHHESITRKKTPIEKDEKAMWSRWGNLFKKGDYYYNPNLTLEKEDGSIKHTSKYFSTSGNYYFYPNKTITTNNLRDSASGVSGKIQQSGYGVNLITYIRAEMGIGEAARGNARAMKEAGVPFGVINFEKGNPSKMEDMSLHHREISQVFFDINILHINADQTPFVVQNLGQECFESKYTIGFWAWELPEFPDKWKKSFDLVHEIWVPSTFVNKAISAKSPVPVLTFPHVIDVVNNNVVKRFSNRKYFNIPDKSFVFLSMFDVHSIFERKNPFGSISAFKNAFRALDTSVFLVIKVNNPDDRTLEMLNDAIGDHKNICVISKHLTRLEIEWLICSIDCYLSLHRSEGFGLGPAEAMARGKVSILTNWSGNTEYMTHDNCIPISFKMEPIGKDLGPYEKHQYWASPDIDEAAFKMKLLISKPEMVEKIGEKARNTISQNFSPYKIGLLMKERIDKIYSKL